MTKTRYQKEVDKEYKRLTTKQLIVQIKSMTGKLDENYLQAESKLIKALEELRDRYNV